MDSCCKIDQPEIALFQSLRAPLYVLMSKPLMVTCRDIMECAVARPSRTIKMNLELGNIFVNLKVQYSLIGYL